MHATHLEPDTPMPVARITTGVTLDEYTRERQLLGEHGESFPGRLLQVCFGAPDDLTVLTVYRSTEDKIAFEEKVLAPLGVPARTEQVHEMRLDPVQCVHEPLSTLLDQAPWPVRRVIGALNSGDTARLLDFFADGARLLAPDGVFSGRARIREYSDRELIGAKGYLDVRQVLRERGAVVVAGRYQSQRWSGPVRVVFTVEADRVTELSLEKDREPTWQS